MLLKSIYQNLQIRNKLIVGLLLAVVPIFIISGIYTTVLVRESIRQNIEQELDNTTESLIHMVQATANASVKNYLRGIAEINRDVALSHYGEFEAGHITRDAMITQLSRYLKSQRIGRTGYIYCVNSRGIATVHPVAAVEGTQFLSFSFVREQIQRKNGYLEYDWKNPGEARPRPKALYMCYVEPLDWIISVSAYREEFTELVSIEDVRASIASQKLGKTGYAFMMDKDGIAIVHPTDEGLNLLGKKYFDTSELQQLLEQETGRISYLWKGPRDQRPVEKLAVFRRIPDLNWIIGSSVCRDELFEPVGKVGIIVVLSIAAGGILSILMIFLIASQFAKRLKKLDATFTQRGRGDYSVRLAPDNEDEIGLLTLHFNGFMARLEQYHQQNMDEIAERERAEIALRASEQKYRQLFEVESDSIFLIQKDSGIILEANPSASHLYGYSPEEFTSRKIETLMAPSDFHEKHHANLPAALSVFYHQKCNGEIFPVEIKTCSFRWNDQMMDVCTVRDLSALASYYMRQQLLSLAVEQSTDIMVITDTSAAIQYVNVAFETVTGYSKDEVLGKNPNILKSGKHGNPFYEKMWQTLLRGESWKGQLTNKKKDGTFFVENATITPLKNSNGEIINYVATKQDVTRELELEKQLLQSQKMEAVGTLAGGIAHDFNNILGGMIGFTELAMRCLPEEEKNLRRYLGRTLEAGERAANLVRQILIFSRQGKNEPKTVQLKLLVEEALQLLRASLPATIEIKKRYKTKSFVFVDPTNIHQVVMNLCTNAAHAMKSKGGVIEVEVSDYKVTQNDIINEKGLPGGNYVQLTISDTGEGIPSQVMDHIFEPFFTTKERGQGTGLGLSMVHGIIKRSGGDIFVESQVGQGSDFRVLFPAANVGTIETSREAPDLPCGTERVLYVDDEPFLIEIAELQLKRLGYKVTTASLPTTALELFRQNPDAFDMVVTDLTMPKMTGDQLAVEIKKIRKDIPIVLCSGFSETNSSDLQASGFVGTLKKPIVIADLSIVLRAALDKK